MTCHQQPLAPSLTSRRLSPPAAQHPECGHLAQVVLRGASRSFKTIPATSQEDIQCFLLEHWTWWYGSILRPEGYVITAQKAEQSRKAHTRALSFLTKPGISLPLTFHCMKQHFPKKVWLLVSSSIMYSQEHPITTLNSLLFHFLVVLIKVIMGLMAAKEMPLLPEGRKLTKRLSELCREHTFLSCNRSEQLWNLTFLGLSFLAVEWRV